MKKRGIAGSLLVLLLFMLSAVLLLYPFIANYIFEHRTDSLVHTVEQTAEEIDNTKRQKQFALARAYNEQIASGHIQLKDPFVSETGESQANDYTSLLCMTEDGVMGFIKIPAIGISLPVYHGTSEQTLLAGAGHLKGSSLPIGGPSTHSVITGHSGLSSAKLFTDLVELKEGDMFSLHIYGEKLVYEIDQIKTVLPYELEDFAVIPGEDYCTLVTCTPYGVNTHRLLVRGRRTEATADREEETTFHAEAVNSKWMQEYLRDVLISIGVFAAGIFLFAGIRFIQKRKGEHKNEDKCQ